MIEAEGGRRQRWTAATAAADGGAPDGTDAACTGTPGTSRQVVSQGDAGLTLLRSLEPDDPRVLSPPTRTWCSSEEEEPIFWFVLSDFSKRSSSFDPFQFVLWSMEIFLRSPSEFFWFLFNEGSVFEISKSVFLNLVEQYSGMKESFSLFRFLWKIVSGTIIIPPGVDRLIFDAAFNCVENTLIFPGDFDERFYVCSKAKERFSATLQLLICFHLEYHSFVDIKCNFEFYEQLSLLVYTRVQKCSLL